MVQEPVQVPAPPAATLKIFLTGSHTPVARPGKALTASELITVVPGGVVVVVWIENLSVEA